MEGATKDLPPKSTVHDYFELWNWDGTSERIHHALYVAQREEEGREASPTVAISTCRPRRALKKGVLARSFGLRRGQEDQGSQAAHPGRHAGLLLNVVVHPADIQDRDGAFHLLRRARRLFPFIERIFADGGYADARWR